MTLRNHVATAATKTSCHVNLFVLQDNGAFRLNCSCTFSCWRCQCSNGPRPRNTSTARWISVGSSSALLRAHRSLRKWRFNNIRRSCWIMTHEFLSRRRRCNMAFFSTPAGPRPRCICLNIYIIDMKQRLCMNETWHCPAASQDSGGGG